MKTSLPVADIVERLSRAEFEQKKAGGFGEAQGLRHSVTLILRMASEPDESLDSTKDDE